MTAAITLATILGNQAFDFQSKLQRDELDKLGFLVGRWEGTATFYSGDREIVVKGFENVERHAGGTALVINATYTMMQGTQEVPIHDVAALIRFDPEKKQHIMLSQLGNGISGPFVIRPRKNGYDWATPGRTGEGTTEYSMNLTDDGRWLEVGYDVVGDKRTKLLELNLIKVK